MGNVIDFEQCQVRTIEIEQIDEAVASGYKLGDFIKTLPLDYNQRENLIELITDFLWA